MNSLNKINKNEIGPTIKEHQREKGVIHYFRSYEPKSNPNNDCQKRLLGFQWNLICHCKKVVNC